MQSKAVAKTYLASSRFRVPYPNRPDGGSRLYVGLLGAGLLLAAGPSHAQTCAFPAAADWKVVEVMKGMTDPSHMAVLPNGEVFAIEQWSGRVWHVGPGKVASVIGTVPTNKGREIEDGMLGMVADLDYATTHWIYILHTPATLGSNRITRYTVTNGTLTNPKLILEYPRTITPGKQEDQRHAGGGMTWNRKTRDLYISTGDDTHPFGDRSVYGPRDPDNIAINAMRTSSNTNDLRGKCLRIRPLPFPDSQTPTAGVGSTYAIPAGNLFPAATAPAGKTRPEIFSMGHRNAYRVKTDSVTGWVYVAEVGADADDYDDTKGPPGYDKITLLKGAANAGWPMVNGDLEPYKVRSYEREYLAGGYTVGQAFSLTQPKNLSAFNTGLVDLPPITVGPLVYYSAKALQKGVSAKLGAGGETIMIGPTYDFNPDLTSAVKLPPYFHRKVIMGDFTRHYLWLMTVGTDGTLKELERIRTGPNVIDMEMGPDGSLYYLDYGAGTVYSLQYTGTQKDWKTCAFIKAGCMDARFREFDPAANLNDPKTCATPVSTRPFARAMVGPGTPSLLAPGARRIPVPAGATLVEIRSASGSLIARLPAAGRAEVELPARLASADIRFVRFLEGAAP